MPNLRAEVLFFLSSLVSHWQSYAIGGAVTGLIGVIERLSDRRLPKRAYFLVFVVTFSVAGYFMVWREQFERAEKVEIKLAEIGKPQNPTNIINVPPTQVVITPQAQIPAISRAAATQPSSARRWSDLTKQELASKLQSPEMKHVSIWVPSVPREVDQSERHDYGRDIADAFYMGFGTNGQVSFGSCPVLPQDPTGIVIIDKTSVRGAIKLITTALDELKIQYRLVPNNGQFATFAPSGPNDVGIYIGEKP
jgi:hypothetical protein